MQGERFIPVYSFFSFSFWLLRNAQPVRTYEESHPILEGALHIRIERKEINNYVSQLMLRTPCQIKGGNVKGAAYEPHQRRHRMKRGKTKYKR